MSDFDRRGLSGRNFDRTGAAFGVSVSEGRLPRHRCSGSFDDDLFDAGDEDLAEELRDYGPFEFSAPRNTPASHWWWALARGVEPELWSGIGEPVHVLGELPGKVADRPIGLDRPDLQAWPQSQR
jgi:hypothetical protein